MYALTVKQPWADAIARGIKPVENRKWAPREEAFGLDLAIHAGAALSPEGGVHGVERYLHLAGRAARPIGEMPRGAIVAVVTLIGAVHVPTGRVRGALDDEAIARVLRCRWTVGPWALVIANVRALAEPVPCRGALMPWPLPAAVEAVVLSATVLDARPGGP